MKNLPEEMMIQIFERVPVKYLLRCMCVQKSWYSFIKSPHFVDAHLIYQKTYYPHLLFRSDHDFFPTPLSLHVDDNVQCEERDLLSSHPIWPERHSVSNGLIFLSNRDTADNYEMCLWNPAIRKFKKVPDPSRSGIPCHTQWVKRAFGFCPKANDFKVVRIVQNSLRKHDIPRIMVDVYSLSKNSWKPSNSNKLICTDYVFDSDSQFLNGTAYFRGKNLSKGGTHVDKEFTIVCYDTDKDMMRLISLPESCALEQVFHYSIQVYGKSIALFTGISSLSGYDMWLLEESGTNNKVCWEKKISFYLPESKFGWSVIGLRSNGEVLLGSESSFDHRLLSKNVEKDEIMDFGWVTPSCWKNKRIRRVNSFAESLIMIDT